MTTVNWSSVFFVFALKTSRFSVENKLFLLRKQIVFAEKTNCFSRKNKGFERFL